MQVYEGVVRDRVVVLPKDVHLDEGLRVEVRVPETDRVSAEALFKRRLVEMGLIEEVRTPSLLPAEGDRSPIHVKGRPLSEQIIEERR